MNYTNNDKKPLLYSSTFLLTVIILISLIAGIICGTLKKGFYIDEFYTYTRANGTGIGVAVDNGEWNDTSVYLDQLTAQGEELFNFTQTYKNCGFHPPVYHYLLHLISSFTPGVFSKWQGIISNLFLEILLLILAWFISLRLTNDNKSASALAVLALGLSPALLSEIVFVRMYLCLAVFALWYLLIHLQNLETKRLDIVRFLIPVCVCGFLGFMTMYYFSIIMFPICFFYCIYLFFIQKRYKDTFIYGFTAMLSIVLSYLYLPTFVFYMKHGKGNKTITSITSDNGLGSRISFFYDLVNRHVFGGFLPVFILLLVIGCIVIYFKIKNKSDYSDSAKTVSYTIKGLMLSVFASVFYYLVMIKITSKAGDTTNRYCFACYPIFIILMVIGSYYVFKHYSNYFKKPLLSAAILMALVLTFCYGRSQVLFLYPEAQKNVDYARANPDQAVVMIHMDNGQYDEEIYDLIQYPEVYFFLYDDLEKAENEKLASAPSVLVYIDKKIDNKEECFNAILSQNPALSDTELLWENTSFDIYLLK